MKTRRILVWVAVSWALTTPARADSVLPLPPRRAGDGSGWVFSIGRFDVARDEKPIEAGIEYRFKPVKLWTVPLTFAAGISGTENENFWVYGLIRYDWEVSSHWIVTPNLGASIYEQGDGKDLGGPIEFRSGLEIAYRFRKDGGARVGLLFYHLSHANIYDDNPGANTLALTLSLGR